MPWIVGCGLYVGWVIDAVDWGSMCRLACFAGVVFCVWMSICTTVL